MQTKHVKQLKTFADEVAERYGNPDRPKNYGKHKVKVVEIVPTSEFTADVFFKKEGYKYFYGFFFYKASTGWDYFLPKDSHILGVQTIASSKAKVEALNFKYNFNAYQGKTKDH